MLRRIPLSTTCCFCFRLHQGFINILYFDIARLFWGILFALITFTKSDATDVDYSIYSLVLTSIFIQTVHALRTHGKGIPKNDVKMYRKYIISKLIYTFCNFFQMTFQDTFSCQFYYETQKSSDKCLSNSISLKIFLGIIWTLIELYFTYIVYCFYVKTLKGFYGPIGSPPIFPDVSNPTQNCRFKKGIALEVQGIKPRGNIGKEYADQGFLIQKTGKTSVVILRGYDPRETLFHDLTLGFFNGKKKINQGTKIKDLKK